MPPDVLATGAGAAHPAQHLSDRAVPAIEARQVRDGEGALAAALRREAVDRQVEAGQLMERGGEDGDPLAAGGGIGSGPGENIERTHVAVESPSALPRPLGLR